jgi:hypothetical protein
LKSPLQCLVFLVHYTIQVIYHLWQREPALGFEILESLARKVMLGPVPNPRVVEVVVNLAVTIFLNQRRDTVAIRHLRAIMRQIID